MGIWESAVDGGGRAEGVGRSGGSGHRRRWAGGYGGCWVGSRGGNGHHWHWSGGRRGGWGAIGGAGQAAEKVGAGASEGARRMKEAMPDREGWGTISRIAWRITDHALAEYTRPYTFGIPVCWYVKEELAKPGADSKEKKHGKQEAAGAMKSKKGADQKPEDVIENFMASGGGGFIN